MWNVEINEREKEKRMMVPGVVVATRQKLDSRLS
jgi:hypothetical protein